MGSRSKQPTDISGDTWGNLYIADAANNRIRQVIPGVDSAGNLEEQWLYRATTRQRHFYDAGCRTTG